MKSVCLANIKPRYLKKAVHSFGISSKYIKGLCSCFHFYAYFFFLSFNQTLSQTIHMGYALARTFDLSLRLISSGDHTKRVKSFLLPESRYCLLQGQQGHNKISLFTPKFPNSLYPTLHLQH